MKESPCGDGFEIITDIPPDGFCWAVVLLECLAKMGSSGDGERVVL
ncbi:MAG: hypothetical protein FWH05_04760 [Oscillospiraceae bacterium]|nr:hypothetical protein [Oscillospiraceae bacterium]